MSQYARSEPGLGRAFTEGVGKKLIFVSSLIPVVATVAYLKITGALCVVVSVLLALMISRLAKKRIGGVTGDILGSVNEITEVGLLFVVIALDRF
jgi:adenosylcobinamide-GDP ribazoletransferase